MDIVSEVLNKVERGKEEAVNSTKVEKLLEPECFPQDLVLYDTNSINLQLVRSNSNEKEDYLRDITRESVQFLFNKLSLFPKESRNGQMFVKLDGAVCFDVPREKHVPVPKPLTKWQKYAKEKGIRKTKKDKSTWDDILQKWVPNYGYRRAAAQKQHDWLIEVPQNIDPNTDMFAKKQEAKKERVAKNEYQRLRNIAASKKIKVPSVGVPPMEGNLHPPQLQLAANIARVSTASVGKFQPKLPKENIQKNKTNVGNKRKKVELLDSKQERELNLSIAESITKKKPKLDIVKAVNNHLQEEQLQENQEKLRGIRNKKGKSKNGPNKSKGSFKRPKGHKGKRIGRPDGGGRKRR